MYSALTLFSIILTNTIANAQSPTASPVLSTVAPSTSVPIGDPYNILTYPICAQACGNQTAPFLPANVPGCNAADVSCACGAYYRSITAACENVTCSDADFQTTFNIAQQLCGPLYSNDSALSTSVASAIASATSVAAAAVTGKDVFNLASWPACAANCAITTNYGGCGPFGSPNTRNVSCTCNPPAAAIMRDCEVAQCSASDLEITTALSYRLCAPAGGLNVGRNLSGVLTYGANTTNTSTPVSPAPISFTGGATVVVASAGACVSFAVFSVATVAVMVDVFR